MIGAGGLARLWAAVGILLVAGIVVLSLVPMPRLPAPEVPFQDKWGHLLAYGLTAWWLGQLTRTWRGLALLFAGLLLLGAGLELIQARLPQRQGEWLDLLADGLGLSLGTALCATPMGRVLKRLQASALSQH